MPFRIHYQDLCLTKLHFTACIHVETHKSMKSIYNANQLYNLIPKWNQLQPIQLFELDNSRPYCLSTAKGKNQLSVVLCNLRESSQLFMIKVRSNPDQLPSMFNHSDKYIVHQKPIVNQQVLSSVMTISIAQITDNTDIEVLSLWLTRTELMKDNVKNEAGFNDKVKNSSLRCLSIVNDVLLTTPITTMNTPPHVSMEICDDASVSQKIIIERSTSHAWIKYIRKKLSITHYYPNNIKGKSV